MPSSFLATCPPPAAPCTLRRASELSFPPPRSPSRLPSPETFALAFANLMALQKNFTLEVALKLLNGCRPDLTKKQVGEVAGEEWGPKNAPNEREGSRKGDGD
jgi:hypothetical protein